MFGGFRERAEQTYGLLRTPGTAFLVVAAPEPDASARRRYFAERLAGRGDAAGRAGAQPGAGQPAGTERVPGERGGQRLTECADQSEAS